MLAGAAVLAALIASSIVGVELGTGGSSARPSTSKRTTSSLDGLTVLPPRLRWVVHPDVPASAVREVDYIIDDQLRWVEHNPPYYYGGDDMGANPGYLSTSMLTPGEHVFTAHVVSAHGDSPNDVVTARVLPAPQPPAALAGTWTRTVTKQDQAKSSPAYGAQGAYNIPPAGVWRLVFDSIGVWELDPVKTGLVTGYKVVADVLFAYAPISMAAGGCGNGGPCGVTRFGHHHIGGRGRACNLAGPFGSYRWSVAGAHLTLTAIHEPCGQRRAVWEGTWTRVR
jgi:hypothetical protein